MSKTLPGFSLNSFIAPSAQAGDWYKNIDYQDAKHIIKEKMVSSVENFIAIGYHLKHIDETEQYKEDGYANIWECAKNEFGFSQAKASRCINICRAYSVDGDSPYIDERFKNYNTSQLQEMLPFKDDEHLMGQITPDMSSREIRKVKNAEGTEKAKENSFRREQKEPAAIEGEYREFSPSTASDDDDGGIAEQVSEIHSVKKVNAGTEASSANVEDIPALPVQQDDMPEETVPVEQVRNAELAEICDAGSVDNCYDLERIKVPLPCTFDEKIYFNNNEGIIVEGVIDQITLRKAVRTQFRVRDKNGACFYFEPSDFGSVLFYTYEEAEKYPDRTIGPDRRISLGE